MDVQRLGMIGRWCAGASTARMLRALVRLMAVLACVGAPAVQANFLDGATLLERLEASGSDLNYAVGFVVGVADAAERQPTPVGEDCFRLPQGVDSMALARQVKRFVGRNRPLHKEPAARLVRAALAEGWPCRTGEGAASAR